MTVGQDRKSRTRGGAWRLAALLTGATLVATLAPFVPRAGADAAPGNKAGKSVAGLPPGDVATFSQRFERELWPTMQEQCLPCHGQSNASQFLLPKEARAAFLKMLVEGQFDGDNHASVVARITTTDPQTIMPPPASGELTQAQKSPFEKFSEEVAARQAASGIKPDELFPAHLETPYSGKKAQAGMDNTFVTFRQLRGKVKQIFGDNWTRPDTETGADRDLFLENAALFGGADFVKRFDESSKASPTYLTGIDLLGRDIASRAYLAKSGPFTGLPALPDPRSLATPTPAYRAAINSLYRKMLLRDATPQEIVDSFRFLKGVHEREDTLTETAAQDVRMALTVKGADGLSTQQEVRIRVTPDRHAVTQEFFDQSDVPEGEGKKVTRSLWDAYTFAPGDGGQKLVISNQRTRGNVSVAGITLRGPMKVGAKPFERWIGVDDKSVRAEGAWQIRTGDGFTSYDDNDENKGKSRLTFPLQVAEAGQYEIALSWRRMAEPTVGKKGRRRGPVDAAERVLVEVVSRDKQSQLATPPLPRVPAKGTAEFQIDETVDTAPFADLRTAFQFGPGDGITLSNTATKRRVVADAVRLLPPRPQEGEIKTAPILRAEKAHGSDKWIKFEGGTFGAYNTVGPSLFQDTDDKGKRPDLSLTFRPHDAQKEGFEAEKFYRVGVVFPGRAENEARVPVSVRARASSPIVQIVAPYHAHTGAVVTLDASASFNVQHGKLTYRWEQVGGPRVTLANPQSPRLTFAAPRLTAEQAAWEGLCRALLGHPDFLFTRPRSLANTTDEKTRVRLQLVKIAQDLVSRTPTPAELARVDRGEPLPALVDSYLKSDSFNDFYFHRVRLYLESHGGAEQDEPARLWTYLMREGRPFKEILTADYTVDTNFKRQARPSYHGKTGVLTMKGFIQGKPSLPHFNYSAQVTEKFLGYIFEVPDSVLQIRDGITAAATTDPNSVCYTCHKVLTPLAYQRSLWDDTGNFRRHDDTGLAIDDSDQGMVASYPYKGAGIEAFALQAQNKERFVRTILQTQFVWYFGRELRFESDERRLYKRLWDVTEKNRFALRPLIRAIVLSPEYLNGNLKPTTQPKPARDARLAKLARFHDKKVVGYADEVSVRRP